MDDYLDPIQQFAYECAIESFQSELNGFDPAIESFSVKPLLSKMWNAIKAFIGKLRQMFQKILQMCGRGRISTKEIDRPTFNLVCDEVSYVSHMVSNINFCIGRINQVISKLCSDGDIDSIGRIEFPDTQSQKAKIEESLKQCKEAKEKEPYPVSDKIIDDLRKHVNTVLNELVELNTKVAATAERAGSLSESSVGESGQNAIRVINAVCSECNRAMGDAMKSGTTLMSHFSVLVRGEAVRS